MKNNALIPVLPIVVAQKELVKSLIRQMLHNRFYDHYDGHYSYLMVNAQARFQERLQKRNRQIKIYPQWRIAKARDTYFSSKFCVIARVKTADIAEDLPKGVRYVKDRDEYTHIFNALNDDNLQWSGTRTHYYLEDTLKPWPKRLREKYITDYINTFGPPMMAEAIEMAYDYDVEQGLTKLYDVAKYYNLETFRNL